MMLDFRSLVIQHNLTIDGIIQIGTHYWQERDLLLSMGYKRFILVEPQKEIFKVLQEKAQGLDAKLFNVALSDSKGTMEMYIESINQSQSSSLLNPKIHLEKYPWIEFPTIETVKVDTLDNIDFARGLFQGIIIDVQGAEGLVFKGGMKTLRNIDYIYAEVNFEELYENCILIQDLDILLAQMNFQRIATGENFNNQGWSDALYIKQKEK